MEAEESGKKNKVFRNQESIVLDVCSEAHSFKS